MHEPFLIRSTRVFTGAAGKAEPLALLIEGGRIARVLPYAEIEGGMRTCATVCDFGDALVTPGLHDAHMHVLHAALFPSALATEYAGHGEADCVAHMAEFARTRPDDGSWLMGHGWRETLWDEPVMPSRASLDAAFPERPVAMYSGDAHTLWTNSAGLARLGIGEGSEPPAGGAFERDGEGRLTGILRETAAMQAVSQVIASFSAAELAGIYRDFFRRLASLGITSVCDMALSTIPGGDCIIPEVYEGLLAADELCVRAHVFPCLGDDLGQIEGLQASWTGEMLRAPGLKQFFDGVSSQHTAWCSEEYANPRFPGDVGRPTVTPERMRELVLAAASHGLAVRIHTIGDAAVHEAIGIFEEAVRSYGRPAQGAHTLEHVEDIQPADIARMARAGIIASVQPQHVTIDCSQPERDLGPERASRMWPFATFGRSGVTLALGSDAPVVPARPGEALFCAVARRHPETLGPEGGWNPGERMGAAEAIRAYTAGSAAVVGRAGELGTLEPGKLADFVVWDADLLSREPEGLLDARPLATYLGGRRTYCA